MEITQVRVKLLDEPKDKLQAFVSLVIDGAFMVWDVKVIEGPRGPFVAMPSRKLMDKCPGCGDKNHLRARYCNGCGRSLPPDRAPRDDQGRPRIHADVAHPIHQASRGELESHILAAYREERARATEPGYVPQDIYGDAEAPGDYEHSAPQRGRERQGRRRGNVRSGEHPRRGDEAPVRTQPSVQAAREAPTSDPEPEAEMVTSAAPAPGSHEPEDATDSCVSRDSSAPAILRPSQDDPRQPAQPEPAEPTEDDVFGAGIFS